MGKDRWFFKYVRADLESEVVGPFETEVDAELDRRAMASYGALCSNVFEASQWPGIGIDLEFSGKYAERTGYRSKRSPPRRLS